MKLHPRGEDVERLPHAVSLPRTTHTRPYIIASAEIPVHFANRTMTSRPVVASARPKTSSRLADLKRGKSVGDVLGELRDSGKGDWALLRSRLKRMGLLKTDQFLGRLRSHVLFALQCHMWPPELHSQTKAKVRAMSVYTRG